MRIPFIKKASLIPDVYKDVSFVKPDRINAFTDRWARQYGKTYCLDIGVGNDNAELFTTVDIDPECKPDIVGDIRCLFAPSDYYADMKKDYPDLRKLETGSFMYIRVKHIIEHIEWIYQQALFDWLGSMLGNGGLLEIDTPNLAYIAKIYLAGSTRQGLGAMPKFPANEHNDLRQSESSDLQRWVNFKLFSGCSPGDYHHACFDAFRLCDLLKKHKFERISIYNGSSLRSIAFRSEDRSVDLDSIISDYIGEEGANA